MLHVLARALCLSSLVHLQARAQRTTGQEQPARPDAPSWAGRLIQAGLLLTSLGGLALGFWLRRHL